MKLADKHHKVIWRISFSNPIEFVYGICIALIGTLVIDSGPPPFVTLP